MLRLRLSCPAGQCFFHDRLVVVIIRQTRLSPTIGPIRLLVVRVRNPAAKFSIKSGPETEQADRWKSVRPERQTIVPWQRESRPSEKKVFLKIFVFLNDKWPTRKTFRRDSKAFTLVNSRVSVLVGRYDDLYDSPSSTPTNWRITVDKLNRTRS